MKRRQFLTAAAVAGLAASFPAPALAQGQRQLKMVTTWPKNFPGLGTGAQRLADRIGRMSGGKLTVKLFAAGELVPEFESFDAVSSGAADLYHAAEYYWQGKSKAFNFFAAVPFGMTAAEINAWIYHGGGQKVWDRLSAKFNLKPFLCGNTGVQMGGWFNKEIHGVEDYKGLKIRMPGLGGEVLAASAPPPWPCRAAKFFLPCNRAPSTPPNGSAPGTSLPSVFTKSPSSITVPGSTSPPHPSR